MTNNRIKPLLFVFYCFEENKKKEKKKNNTKYINSKFVFTIRIPYEMDF
jgi:hypothetical protein